MPSAKAGGLLRATPLPLNPLKSKKRKDIDIPTIAAMSDKEVHQTFAELRWGDAEMQACPGCGSFRDHYWRESRQQWRCRDCGRDFSVTSGTPFAYHKKSLREILWAMFRFINNEAGVSTIEHGNDFGWWDKTSWYFQSKLREVLLRTRPLDIGDGVLQADGAFFGGKRRDANNHGRQKSSEARVEAIKIKIQNSAPTGRSRRRKQFAPGGKANAKRRENRRCVLVLTELHPEKGLGSRRTIVTVARFEHEEGAIPFVRKYAPEGATIMTDEGNAFNSLSTHGYLHQTVAHAECYVTKTGVNNNQAESYNSRLRRSEYGVHHRYTPLHLMEYANEKAWRSDCRRLSLKTMLFELLASTLKVGKAVMYRGYYQGNRPCKELLHL